MATVISLTEEQISYLLEEMRAIEGELKQFHDELADLAVPGETLRKFRHLHDRYSEAATFIERQRQLRTSERH